MPRLTLPSSVRRRVVPRVDAVVIRRYSELARDVDDGGRRAFLTLAEGDLSRTRPAPAACRAVVDQFHRLYNHRPKRTWQNTRFLGVDVRKTPLDPSV